MKDIINNEFERWNIFILFLFFNSTEYDNENYNLKAANCLVLTKCHNKIIRKKYYESKAV